MTRQGLKRLTVTCATLALAALTPAAALAASADRNKDGIPDRWEKKHGLSLKVKQTNRDQDRDGLTNLTEYQAGTDPRDVDSDNDGIRDGREDADHDGVKNRDEQSHHSDAGDADSDNDGIRDGQDQSGDQSPDDRTAGSIDQSGSTDQPGTTDADHSGTSVESPHPADSVTPGV